MQSPCENEHRTNQRTAVRKLKEVEYRSVVDMSCHDCAVSLYCQVLRGVFQEYTTREILCLLIWIPWSLFELGYWLSPSNSFA